MGKQGLPSSSLCFLLVFKIVQNWLLAKRSSEQQIMRLNPLKKLAVVVLFIAMLTLLIPEQLNTSPVVFGLTASY